MSSITKTPRQFSSECTKLNYTTRISDFFLFQDRAMHVLREGFLSYFKPSDEKAVQFSYYCIRSNDIYRWLAK
jgi:hypothetical protein